MMSVYQDISDNVAILMQMNEIGCANPVQLCNAMFWFNYDLFERKKAQDHARIRAEDYKITKINGRDRLEYHYFKYHDQQLASAERADAGQPDNVWITEMDYAVEYFKKYLKAIQHHGPFYRKLLPNSQYQGDSVIQYSEEAMTIEDINELQKWKEKCKIMLKQKMKKMHTPVLTDDELLCQLGIIGKQNSELLLKAVYWLNFRNMGLTQNQHYQIKRSNFELFRKKKKFLAQLKFANTITETEYPISDDGNDPEVGAELYQAYLDAISTRCNPDSKFYFRPIIDTVNEDKVIFSDRNLSLQHLKELYKWATNVLGLVAYINNNSLVPDGCLKLGNDDKSKFLAKFNSLPIQHGHLTCVVNNTDCINISNKRKGEIQPSKKRRTGSR